MISNVDLANNEILTCLKNIQNQIGIQIPITVFQYKETNLMKKKWTINGEYSPLEEKIYLNPKLCLQYAYNNIEDNEQCKQILYKLYVGMKPLSSITEEEIRHFMINMNQGILQDLRKVVYHECGHYIHDIYFQSKAMRIPIESKIKVYAQKNAKENFAVAFEEYMNKKLDKESKRYKRISEILRNLGTK